MKRVIALLLCLSFVLSFSNISVFAEGENYKFARIKVTANKKDYYETVIVDDDTLYMATESIAKYATYNTSKHKLFFMRRDQDDSEKAYKFAFYNESKQTFTVKIGGVIKTIENVECKKYNDSYYLPIHMIFPYLDSKVSSNGEALIISSDDFSLADALYNFFDQDYQFEMSHEFGDSTLLALGFYLPSYIFDTITNIHFDRATLFNLTGNFDDYLTAYKNIIFDDEEYLKIKAGRNPEIKETAELLIGNNLDILAPFGDLDDIMEEVYDIDGQTYTFLDYIDFDVLDDVKDYYDEIMFLYDYFNTVDDHTKMIGAVYSKDIVKNDDLFKTKEYLASIAANAEYSNAAGLVIPAVLKRAKDTFDDVIETDPYIFITKAAGGVSRKIFALNYTENVPLLPYYQSIEISAQGAYAEYNHMTDSKYTEEQKRLSLLMYLLASKRCYQLLYEVFKERHDWFFCLTPELYKGYMDSYQKRINQISARLTLLYMADNTRDATKKTYSDESKAIKKAIKSMSVKGVSEDEFKYKNLADWKWIIEPSVEADDIQPVRYGDYLYDKNGCHFNSLRAQVYDKLSIITEESDGNSNDEKYGLISYSGMKISSCNFDHIFFIDQYKDRFYVLGGEVSNKIINEHYEIDRKRQYDAPMEVQSYLRWVKDYNGLYECELGPIIDLNDKVVYNEPSAVIYTDKIKKVSKYIYEAISPDEYVVFVNNGRIVTEHIFEDAGCFSDGVIPLKLNGKWGYIDGNGKTILPFEFDSIRQPNVNDNIYDASNGYIVVKKDNQYAIFDVTGSLVINYGVFEEIRPVYEGMAWVKQDGKWGVIGLSQDIQGVSIAAPKEATAEIEATVSDKNGVRLRCGPGTDYDVIGILSNKKKVTICGRSDDWTYIQVGSNYGWVKSSLLGIDLPKASKYNEKKIQQALENGHVTHYSSFIYDNTKDIGCAISYFLTYHEDWEKGKYYESAQSIFGDDGYMIEYSDIKTLDQGLFEMFHIKLSRDKKFIKYCDIAAYKNGKYYYRNIDDGWLPENKFKLKAVCRIKDDLYFVSFTNSYWVPVDADKYDVDEVSNDSAVIYTGASQYALVEYQKGKQTLSAERYLHYLNDFE